MQFWEIWQENESWLYRLIYASVRNHTDTEDILHDTLIKALVGFPRLREEHKARAWLVSIASHTTIDFFRRRSREQLWELDAFDRIASKYEGTSENKIMIDQFLSELPDDWRSIVIMNLYSGISARSIAQITGGSIHAIHKRLTRTYRLLAEALSDKEVEL